MHYQGFQQKWTVIPLWVSQIFNFWNIAGLLLTLGLNSVGLLTCRLFFFFFPKKYVLQNTGHGWLNPETQNLSWKGQVENYRWIFDCKRINAPNLCIVQGTTVHQAKSDWLYFMQPKKEKLYTVNKNKTRSWLWLRSWTPYYQIQTQIEESRENR